MPERSTPSSTPMARLWVITTPATVASMTMLDERGCVRRFPSEDQLNVPTETMIMMATSAGIGMMATRPPRTTIMTSRKTPAENDDSRPRPPDFTLMTDCPIMAQPAMPPMNPVAVLATPCATHSRFLSLGVSVSSSTICAVISDSSRPTAATAAE